MEPNFRPSDTSNLYIETPTKPTTPTSLPETKNNTNSKTTNLFTKIEFFFSDTLGINKKIPAKKLPNEKQINNFVISKTNLLNFLHKIKSKFQTKTTCSKDSGTVSHNKNYEYFKKTLIKNSLFTVSLTNRLELIQQRIDSTKHSKLAKIIESYIHDLIKDFGHEWTLGGIVQFNKLAIHVEGNYSPLMHAKLFKSVSSFLETSETLLNTTEKNDILSTLKKSIVFSYQKNGGVSDLTVQELVNDYQAGKAVTVRSGPPGHAVEVTIQGDYLCYTNRGMKAFPTTPNMQIFKISQPALITKAFFRLLLNPNAKHLDWLENPQNGMKTILGLEPLSIIDPSDSSTENQKIGQKQNVVITKKSQKVGNCTWANAKGGFHALLFLSSLKKAKESGLNENLAINQAKERSSKIYKEWSNNSRIESLKHFIHSIEIIEPHLTNIQKIALRKFLDKISQKFQHRYKEDDKVNTNANLTDLLVKFENLQTLFSSN